MYNGIGLSTPRGSGTNGHVQRNWAFVRSSKKDNNYRTEDDIKKLDATLNRPPNKDILDHDRKRKMEVKCLEFEEILEKQGCTPDEIKSKVDSYRQKLMGHSKNDLPKDEFGRISVRETHQIAEAQQQKNAKLREAFNISEYFVEGSSFDSDRKAKEDLAKSLSLQKELDAQRARIAGQNAASDMAIAAATAETAKCLDNKKKRYDKKLDGGNDGGSGDGSGDGDDGGRERDGNDVTNITNASSDDQHLNKKKKKKRTRESSASPERKRDKKKKSKKHKKDNKLKRKKLRKRKASISQSDVADSDKASNDNDNNGDIGDDDDDDDDSTVSEADIKKMARMKRTKKDKKKHGKKRKKDRRSSSSSDRSIINTPKSPIQSACHESKRKISKREEKISSSSKSAIDTNPIGNRNSRERVTHSRLSHDKRRGSSNTNRKYSTSLSLRRSRSRSRGRHSRQEHRDRYKSPQRNSRCRRWDDNNRDNNNKRRSRSYQRQRRDNSTDRNKNYQRKYSRERSIDYRKDNSNFQRKRQHSRSLSPPPKLNVEKEHYAKHGSKRNSTRRNSRSVSRARARFSRHDHHEGNIKNRSASPTPSRSQSIKIKRRKQHSTSPPIKRPIEHHDARTVFKESKLKKYNEKKSTADVVEAKSDVSQGNRKLKGKRSTSSSRSASDSEYSRSRTPTRITEQPDTLITEDNFDEKSAEIKQSTPTKQRGKLSENRSMDKDNRNDDRTKSIEKNNQTEVSISSKNIDHTSKKSTTPSPLPISKSKSESKVGGSCSCDSSELSYSPARRNPERYRDILQTSDKRKSGKQTNEHRCDNDQKGRQQSHLSNMTTTNKRNGKDDDTEKEKEKPTSSRKETEGRIDRDRNTSKLAPIVRLHSQSEDDSDSDGDAGRNADNMASALNEFQESRRERELKELKMLEHLKTGIAAKAKEKIKTIEKMAANASSIIGGTEVSDIFGYGRRNLRHILNENYLVKSTATETSNHTNNNNKNNNNNNNDKRSCTTSAGAVYPQNRYDIKIKRSSRSPTPFDLNVVKIESTNKEDNETLTNCKQSHTIAANGHAYTSPTTFNNVQTFHSNNNNNNNSNIRDKRKREYEREQDRDNHIRDRNYYKRDRDNERGRRSPLQHGSNGGNTGGVSMGNISRRSNVYYRGRISGNNANSNIGSGGGGGGAGSGSGSGITSHSLLTHNSSTSHSQNCGGHGSGPLIPGPYLHSINATTFNRPSRINNTPLITATQFNNQMLSKQSGSVLVGRRNHRTALSLGLSGTPTTNYTNSNLLLTKVNALHLQNHYPHSYHHHHQHQHHHHHHGTSNSNHSTTQITDRILMAATLAAHGHHHNPMTYNHNSTAVNSLNYLQQQQQQQHQQQLQQQQKSKIIIKPFKIHDSQPLVAALADSTLVDTIVSKVSTATVKAQEIAARRSRSRSRRTRSRSRHHDHASTERRSKSHSRSRSSSSSSRSRSRSSRSRVHSKSSQSSSSSHSSSRSSSSSSTSSSRSGGSRSPSIPRHRGSPSFLDRRRITSARKRPIPYHRKTPSDLTSCYCSSCCSRDSSQHSNSFSPPPHILQSSCSPSSMIF